MADIKKFRESVKNGTSMCFACGGSSNEDRRDIDPNTVPRELVSCDYCVLSWHLDCLDPPRASNPKLVAQDETEPLPKVKGKKKDKPKVITTWMCPNHVTDDPNGDGLQGTNRAVNGGRIGKLRRPKHATIKDVSLRRGFHNNGLIEVLNDPSDTEKEVDETGIIYRLSEKAIKLDFIDRIKQYVLSLPPYSYNHTHSSPGPTHVPVLPSPSSTPRNSASLLSSSNVSAPPRRPSRKKSVGTLSRNNKLQWRLHISHLDPALPLTLASRESIT